MRQRFIVTDACSDAAWMSIRLFPEASLEFCVALAQHNEPRSRVDEIANALQHEIEPLLPGQAADNPQQRSTQGAINPQFCKQCCFAGGLSGKLAFII